MTFSFQVKDEVVSVLNLTLDCMLGDVCLPDDFDMPEDEKNFEKSSLLAEADMSLDEIFNPEVVLYAIVVAQMNVNRNKISFQTTNYALVNLLNRTFEAMFGHELLIEETKDLYKVKCRSKEDLDRLFRRINNELSFDIDNVQASLDFSDLDEVDKRAILQAVFLGGGSIADPSRKFSIEIIIKRSSFAKALQALLTEMEINHSCQIKKGNRFIYIRGADDISKYLGILGAQQTLLSFESLRIEKELRNSINRAVNCDKANVSRLVRASSRQIAAISFLEEKGILDTLSEEVRVVARIRKDFPELSLNDLSAELPSEFRLSRSALMRRLNYLTKTAEKHGYVIRDDSRT